jgi:hypothetical protein
MIYLTTGYSVAQKVIIDTCVSWTLIIKHSQATTKNICSIVSLSLLSKEATNYKKKSIQLLYRFQIAHFFFS